MKSEPRIRVERFTTEGTSGAWTVTWRITNDGDQPLRLLSAQHPHSHFRTPETSVDREVAPGAVAALTLPVQFSESPGDRVENPFLILVFRDTVVWRLLARVRVTAGANGEPIAGQSVVVSTREVRTP